ncbi:hypothetical protein [Corallococcus sp. EGB]|nr:hypothetical protein [Corallococcus sp. EGB]
MPSTHGLRASGLAVAALCPSSDERRDPFGWARDAIRTRLKLETRFY